MCNSHRTIIVLHQTGLVFYSMKQLFSRPFWPLQLLIAAMILAISISSWLLYQWQQQQTALHIQLLTNSASLLSIQPLQQQQPAALEVTLHALQQHSALPIRAMAVFDRSQQIFASTSKAESWLEQAAQSLDAEPSQLSDPAFQLISMPIWADRTGLTQSTNAATFPTEHNTTQAIPTLLPPPAVSSRQLGYLLILIEKSPKPMMIVYLPFILLFIIAVVLIWLTSRNIAKNQRLQIESLARQLADEEQFGSATDPAFSPMIKVWQEKQHQLKLQSDALKQEFQIELQRLEGQLQLSQQTNLQLNSQQQLVMGQLQSSHQLLDFWQLCMANADKQNPVDVVRQTQLLTLYTRLQDPDFMLQPDALLLPDWLLQCYEKHLQSHQTNTHFIFEEDTQAYAFRVNLDPELIAHLIALLVAMCRQLATEPEIIFSYRIVESPSKQIKFKIKYVGRSVQPRWKQVLVGSVDRIKPEDLEAELCRSIVAKLHGEMQIDSIDDVGTQLDISLPVSWQKTNHTKSFQSILVVDEKECRLPLIKHSLTAMGEQVHSCHAYSHLTESLQRRLVDLLVLVLPQQTAELSLSLTELEALQQRFEIHAFAPLAVVAQWQSLLSFPVKPMPLLIGQLSAPQSQTLSQHQLLVVDDNLTNLSYVRAVLAMEGLHIDIAMTGDEAIKMASNNRYQLILMDIQLPDLPGTEVTKQIRQLRHHQQTIILAFTAHALPDEIASFRLAGMDDVLIKPLDTQKIAHILGRIKGLTQS